MWSQQTLHHLSLELRCDSPGESSLLPPAEPISGPISAFDIGNRQDDTSPQRLGSCVLISKIHMITDVRCG